MKNAQVLLIDDDDLSRTLTLKILEGAGYVVTAVSDIATGLEQARRSVPHLIVLDLVMPDGSGFDFLEQRRATPELVGIPVLVLSGLADRASIYKATALGAADYTTKPLDAKVVLQKARKLLHDREFVSRSYPKGQRPVVKALVNGKIVNANEVGFLLEVPAKIAPDTTLDVTSPLLDTLGCASCVFQKTKSPARAGFPGQYLNDVSVVGLNRQAVERIRQLMKGWKK